MAALYPHKVHGWQIKYHIYYMDGTYAERNKYAKKKSKAMMIYQDAERLEILAVKQRLTREEIIYLIHSRLITPEDAARLSQEDIPIIAPAGITWDTLENIYLRHIRTVGSENTRAVYPYIARRITEYFGHSNPLKIKDEHIKTFIDTMRDAGKAKSTINKYLSALRIMFDYPVQQKLIPENPARRIKNFNSAEERIPRVLYPDEIQQFIQKLDQHSHLLKGYFREMMLMYLYAGLRRQELLRLYKSNVNLKGGYIRVEKTKNNKERIVQIHPVLESVIEAILRRNGENKGKYLFGGLDMPCLRPHSVTRAFFRFCRNANLPDGITLHSLRHTFITYLLKAGNDLKSVQTIAGHKKLSTTYKYIHLINSKQTVSKIDFKAEKEAVL